MAEPLIVLEQVTKIYGSGETSVRALDQVSLHVAEGEFFAIMGPSGCGKSTLLNLLGALDKPTSGSICIAGQDLARLPDVDKFRASTVGFVFQLHNLLPTLTAQGNVEVPMEGQPVSSRERSQRARQLLEMVGLGDRRGHLPGQLSGGQRQRVAVARALANRPKLILADEPTGALDSQSGEEVLALLGALNRSERTTIAVVTHDVRVAQVTGRILRMHDGRIMEDHSVNDPLAEDLRLLAHSKLGESILDPHDRLVEGMTEEEELVLRTLLLRLRRQNDPSAALDGATLPALRPEP